MYSHQLCDFPALLYVVLLLRVVFPQTENQWGYPLFHILNESVTKGPVHKLSLDFLGLGQGDMVFTLSEAWVLSWRVEPAGFGDAPTSFSF